MTIETDEQKAAKLWNILNPKSNFYNLKMQDQRKYINAIKEIKKVIND